MILTPCVNNCDMFSLNNQPVGLGLINGASIMLNNAAAYATHNSLKTDVYMIKVSAFTAFMKKLPLLRGIFLFFYYIYMWFKLLDMSYTHFSMSAARKSIKNKRFITNRNRVFYALAIILIVGFFILFPLFFGMILRYFGVAMVGSGVLYLILFNILCLMILFLMLKGLSVGRSIFKFNYAVNKVCNSYHYGRSLKYSKVLYSSPYMVLTPFNFFILSMILIYIILPFVVFFTGVLFYVFKFLFAILIICIAYEVLFVIEYSRRRFILCEYLSYLFLWLTFFSISKCENKHIKIACVGMEEAVGLNFDKVNKLEISEYNLGDVKMSLVLNDVKNQLLSKGIDDTAEAEYLIAEALKIKRSDVLFLRKLSEQEYKKIKLLLRKRLTRKSIDKIVRHKEFYREEYYVDDNVLSPRPETELLTEKVINYINKKLKNPHVLDMCTGSGCIAISVAKNAHCSVTAADLSRRALAIAKRNAVNLSAKVNFVRSDMFKNLKETAKFDIIMSNPPYIATGDIKTLDKEVRDHDPIMALDGGADGYKFYRIIANEAHKFLGNGGVLFLEVGAEQAGYVSKLLENNFTDITIQKDYAGVERYVAAVKK